MNICVFTFDFSGCGKSEGEWISLGWHEKDDLKIAIEYLRDSNKVSTVGKHKHSLSTLAS